MNRRCLNMNVDDVDVFNMNVDDVDVLISMLKT